MSDQLIDVEISQRDAHTDSVSVFELKPLKGAILPPFEAGAHIDVVVEQGLIRQYSLSNDPAEAGIYRLGILRDPNSRGGSERIHAAFQVGTKIQISAPRNHFPLNLDAHRTVLVGGGIGITPMLTMAYTLKAAGKSFELHYCCRTRASAAFLEELHREFGDQLFLHFDDEGDEQRFNPQQVLPPADAGTHLYVCGPSGFMDWLIEISRQIGYSDDCIHFEYFNAEVDSSGAAFEVVAARSGKTVKVQEGQSITDALASVGIKVKVSCEQGVCGTCLCDVIEGMPDHKDRFLTEEEKEDNDQIVVCCSRAKSERLVLDI